MALIIHFERVPRYQNMWTKEYETLPRETVERVNEYYNWRKAKHAGYANGTFKDWCGLTEDMLPDKYTMNYYREFYNEKKVYNDYDGELIEKETIFEDLCRLVKMNQIFNWLINNVTDGKIDKEYHEVTNEQMFELYKALRMVKRAISYDNGKFKVEDEEVAKKYMPLMEEVPPFWGVSEYNEVYAEQVVNAYFTIDKIRRYTNFEKETLYFVTSW